MAFSKKLKQLREQKGWSQLDIAHQLDVSQSAYNKWESGQTKPTLNHLQKISEIFEVNFWELLKELLPSVDLSNAKFDGHSYVVNPISSTINFQSQEVINKILENQNNISTLIEKQNVLIENLLQKK